MLTDVRPEQVLVSLVLVIVAVGLARWLRLGVTRSLVSASLRAALQLVAVGFVFGLIVTSSSAFVLAWLWVVFMIVITVVVSRRRAPELPAGVIAVSLSVSVTVALCLAVIFGFGVIDYRPANVIVISGIIIGNTLPSLVLGSNRLVDQVREGRGQFEALVALGFSVSQITKVAGAPIVRNALVPQIERTNVVGLIALPGAMTGLLLAGVEPINAVLIQLIVMYLVLGSVAVSVIVVVVVGMRSLFDPNGTIREIAP